MKKVVLAILTMAVHFGLQAQITVESTDVVTVGDTAISAYDSIPPTTVTVTPAGGNQTWDFSGLQEDERDTTIFVDASTLPGSQDFPSANIGFTNPSDPDSWQFVVKNSSELKVVGGVEIDSADTAVFAIELVIFTFPSTNGTTFNSSSSQIAISDSANFDPDGPGPHPVVDSIRVTVGRGVDSEIDAWGSMTTPTGTFDVLRQKVLEIEADTVEMYVNGGWTLISPEVEALVMQDAIEMDTSFTYRFWTDAVGAGFPVVEFEYDADADEVGEVSYLAETLGPTSVVETGTHREVNVYPNPARDRVWVDAGQANVQFELFSIQGQQILNERMNQRYINVQGLDSGYYLYRISNASGQLIKTGKLNVIE